MCSSFPMSLVVSPLSDTHVPSGDDPDEPLSFSFEDNHEESARSCSAKGRILAPPRLSEERRECEHLLGFFWLDTVAESKMQNISIIPLEPRDAHPGPRLRNTLHYPGLCVKLY